MQDLTLIKVNYAPGKRGIRKICELVAEKILIVIRALEDIRKPASSSRQIAHLPSSIQRALDTITGAIFSFLSRCRTSQVRFWHNRLFQKHTYVHKRFSQDTRKVRASCNFHKLCMVKPPSRFPTSIPSLHSYTYIPPFILIARALSAPSSTVIRGRLLLHICATSCDC